MLRKRVDARRARSARGGGISSCRAGTWTRTSWSSTVMPRAVALRQRVSCMKRQASTSATVSTGTPAAHPVLRLSHPVLRACGAAGTASFCACRATAVWSARRRVSPGAQGGVFLLERKEACVSFPASYPLLTRLLPLPLPPLLVLPSSPSCLHCLASREGHARAAGRGRAGQRRVAWPRPKRLRLASASCPCVCAQAVDWQCKVEGTLVPCLGPLP
jgi:hypothetical protein